MNSRYVRVDEIEAGAFSIVYKGLDCFVTQEGQVSPIAGDARLLKAEHLALVQEIAKVSPEIEYVRGDPDEYTEEKKNAI